MFDEAIEHIARAIAYRALSPTRAPGRAQAELRSTIMLAPASVTDEAMQAWKRITGITVDGMPPDPDDVSLLIDAIAMRHGFTDRASAWRACGINPNRGRDLLSRQAHSVDWPIWFTIRHTAIGA